MAQSRDILVYDVIGNTWTRQGEWPVGIATVPAVVRGSEIMTISGETAPGVRTPVNASASAGYHFEMSTVDYAVLILTIIVLAIIIVSAVRNGVKNVASVTDPNTKPGLWAWVAVIVLWFVVMLNYFDRQLLSALHEPIVRDIPQTEAQFGMVTSVFLLIYALLSPVGGFLADRYSRRLMILCSLVVWSVVTWWTGHAEDYTSLLIARGAMGISEAFYIPAALALITDYHRGSTRSIATGLHMSGIYVGMAVAGFGATMASWTGWRMTFALFGLIGVAYAVILILFLKDPSKAPADTAQAKKPSVPEKKTVLLNVDNDEQAIKEPSSKLSTGAVLSSLLSGRPMWMLLAVVAFAGAGNWFLLTWYPTLLQDKYQLSSAEAAPPPPCGAPWPNTSPCWEAPSWRTCGTGATPAPAPWCRASPSPYPAHWWFWRCCPASSAGTSPSRSCSCWVWSPRRGWRRDHWTPPSCLCYAPISTSVIPQPAMASSTSHPPAWAPHLLLWGMVQGSGRSADHHPGGRQDA